MKIKLIPSTPQSEVRKCVNLAPDPHGRMGVVLPPREEPIPAGWTPVTVAECGGAEMPVVVSGTRIGLLADGIILSQVELGFVPARVSGSSGRLLVHDGQTRAAVLAIDSESRTLSYDSDFPTDTADIPVPRFGAASPVESKIPEIQMSRLYISGDGVSATDRRSIGSTVIAALEDLDRTARRFALLWQPVIAAVRIRNSLGAIVGESHPVLLMPDSRLEAVSLTFSEVDNTLLLSHTLEIGAHNLQVDFTEAQSSAFRGCTAELVCTPPLPLTDFTEQPTAEPGRRADSRAAMAVTFAPSALSTGVGAESISSGAIGKLLAVFDTYSQVVGSKRLDGSAATLAAEMAPGAGCAADSQTLRAMLSARVQSLADVSLAAISAPNYPLWDVSADFGEALLTGGISAVGAAPPLPSSMSVSTATGTWHAYTQVEFSDGSTLVSQQSSDADMPVSFGPLISYPSAGAVALTIVVRSPAAGIMQRRFDLVPDPSGRRAYYVSADGKPVVLQKTGGTFAVPLPTAVARRYNSHICLSRSISPFYPLCTARLPVSRIVAMAAPQAGQSSWDYGRSRFYVFTTEGVFMVNADPARASLSYALIDSRMADGPQSVAAVPGGVAAILSGDVVIISGSKVKSLGRVSAEPQALAWVQQSHELWVVTPKDIRAICFDHAYGRYTIPMAMAADTTVRGHHNTWMQTEAGQWVVCGHGEPSASVSIEWEAETAVPKPKGVLRTLAVDAGGSADGLVVSVFRSHSGVAAPAPDIALSLSGNLYSAIVRKFVMAPAVAAVLSLKGEVSADTVFNEITVD